MDVTRVRVVYDTGKQGLVETVDLTTYDTHIRIPSRLPVWRWHLEKIPYSFCSGAINALRRNGKHKRHSQ